jgi:hypothetical protein
MELSLRLTALTLLLRPMGPWAIRAAILSVAVLALLTPRVLLASSTWMVLSLLIAVRIGWDWPLADNHIYLLAYWTFAIALALGHPSPAAALARSSVVLLAIVFVMAVVWKAALSPDFLDGRFFRVTLLTDVRFDPLITRVGGLTPDDVAHNRMALAALPEGAELLDPPPLVETSSFRRLVWISTIGSLLLEAVIAVAGLVTMAGRTGARAMHAALLAFCALTYAFAPVAGFGWLLLSMGAAPARADQRLLRAAYVATWMLVLVYAEVRA